MRGLGESDVLYTIKYRDGLIEGRGHRGIVRDIPDLLVHLYLDLR